MCCACGGGDRDTPAWQWAVDEAKTKYTNWWQGSMTEDAEPTNWYRGGLKEECVEMSLEGKWNDMICRCSDLDPSL